MSVISHAETSGLGSKATDPNWQSQFVGSTEDVSVTRTAAPSTPSPAPPSPPAACATVSTPPVRSWKHWVKEGARE